MSGGQIALDRVGVTVDNYYASEIDKYAIKVTQANYPDTVQLGCITDIRTSQLPHIDLLIGGSPCQGFSFAGKQKAFDDPRSALFYEYVRLLGEIRQYNPSVKFMLENVRMKKEHLAVITLILGVEPICINSALVSAQNRVRYYWTNIEGIQQPEDRGIVLADILEAGVVDRDKSFCIDANYWKGTNVEQYINKSRRQIAFTERRTEEAKRIRKEFRTKYNKDFSPRRGKELTPRDDDKMNCLTATYSIKEHTLIDECLYYRKLTPIECERLQTVSDNYTNHVSNTQRYKMLGNGWTIDVVAHIFRSMSCQ